MYAPVYFSGVISFGHILKEVHSSKKVYAHCLASELGFEALL